MKKRSLVCIISVLPLLCFMLLVACVRVQPLATPENLSIDTATNMLTWDAVEYATGGYKIDIDGPVHTTHDIPYEKIKDGKKEPVPREYDLSRLTVGTYAIKVQAITNDRNYYKNSEWSKPIEFIVPKGSRLEFKLINNNTEYEVIKRGAEYGEVVIGPMHLGKPITSIGKGAFQSQGISLTSIIIGENVRTIGENAFYNCTQLTSVAIGSNVTSIGARAFYNNTRLQSIVIPDSVTEVGFALFENCSGLTSVTLGSGITSISDMLFYKCTRLTEVKYGNNVSNIGTEVFYACNALTSFTVGNNITTVGIGIFRECKELKEVIIGDKVTSIPDFSFFNCPVLNNVALGNRVESIGSYAFYGCAALVNIVIPDSVTSIGYLTFYNSGVWLNVTGSVIYVDNWAVGCNDSVKAEIDEIKLESGIVGIAANAFYHLPLLESVTITNDVKYINNYAFGNCPFLQLVIFGTGVITIGDYAFRDCIRLSNNFTLPPSVSKIGFRAFENTDLWNKHSESVIYAGNWAVGFAGEDVAKINNIKSNTVGISDYAFYSAATITEITIPNNVKYIGAGAFRDCRSLLSIGIPENVIIIGAQAFYDCRSLQTVTIGSGITFIDDYTFFRCNMLSRIDLSNNITSIGRSVFYECKELINVTFGVNSKLYRIGEYAFFGCSSLGSLGNVQIPSKVTSIGDHAFRGCMSMAGVDFESGSKLASIGKHAFRECQSITTIAFPESLTSLGDSSFRDCIWLTSVVFSDSITYIPFEGFRGCTKLSDITFGGGITNIGDYAFFGCGELKELSFPYNVTDIGAYAFRNTGLLTLIIPKTVTSVGKHAFNGNTLLTIYSEASIRPAKWDQYWNSSNRPVFWGCIVSGDDIVSFHKTATSIQNPNAVNGITSPFRDGYLLAWSLVKGGSVDYTEDTVNSAPNDITLWSSWIELQPLIYHFETNDGTMVRDIYDYRLFYVPMTTRKDWDYSYDFKGWYDNEELSGKPVNFPYNSSDGTKTTLYAKWEETKPNGKSLALAYKLLLDTPIKTTTSLLIYNEDNDTFIESNVYYVFVAETTGEYAITMADSASTIIAYDSTGNFMTFGVAGQLTLTLTAGKKYWFTFFVDSTQQSEVEVVVSLLQY